MKIGSIRLLSTHITFMGGHSYNRSPWNKMYPENIHHTLALIDKIKRVK